MNTQAVMLAQAALVLHLAGGAPLVVQSPGGVLSPVNAVSDGRGARVMLSGADVVAYFTEGKYRQGDPAIQTVVEGVTFRFASTGHKALFDKDPHRYTPQYGGY